MSTRVAATIVIALACSACANEKATGPLSYGAAPMHLVGAMTVLPEDAVAPPQKKTMASKVLSAIALEQVTGRKPDPSRFNDLN